MILQDKPVVEIKDIPLQAFQDLNENLLFLPGKMKPGEVVRFSISVKGKDIFVASSRFDTLSVSNDECSFKMTDAAVDTLEKAMNDNPSYRLQNITTGYTIEGSIVIGSASLQGE